MRVRIVRTPTGRDAEFFDLSRFRVDEVYEVGPRLAEYLMACGFAEPVTTHAPDVAADRRRPPPS
jgi:hypothetical protein